MAQVKAKIDYPPFETKEWVPPDQRPKKKRKPKYVKPPGITQKLEISSLVKIWHKFRVYPNRQLLLGSFSETHKRFSRRSNGYQTPCNCVVAIVYSQFVPMKKWDFYVIDTILYMGNDLYMSTIHRQSDRSKTDLMLCEVYPSFYYGDTKVTVTMKGNKHSGKLFEEDSAPFLANVIVNFFDEHASGVLTVGKRHLAVWTADKSYYLFDPSDHDCRGSPWLGIRGQGYAFVMRFQDTVDLVTAIHDNFCVRDNLKFVITPCAIIRLVKIPMFPPDGVIKQHCPKEPPVCGLERLPSKEKIQVPEVTVPVAEPEEEIFEDDIDVNDELVDSVSKIPIQKVRAESVTYYANVVPSKMGILRASTHQCDTRYTKQQGKQSVANAIMALTMLRQYKSREWFRRIVDDILKYGERYYGDSVKKLPAGTPLKVSNVLKMISLYDFEYYPSIDEYTTIGRLQSTTTAVLDLVPALEEFFKKCPTCVITGPLTVAAWFEDGLFYMFDPNERDSKGKRFQLPGVACVTWFTDLVLLVDLYINNLEPILRREPFVLSKVVIKDYEYKADDWNDFVGVSARKWILRGSFNQNDRRFVKEVRNVQCTAAAALALAMAFIKPIEKWNSTDVDEILIASEEYYKATVDSLKSRNKYRNPKLLVDELLRKYVVEDNEMTFDINDCLVNGLLDGNDNEGIFSLVEGIRHFFQEDDYGILSSRGISVAIWKSDQVYYYYDSHSRDEKGLSNHYGTACVLRFLIVEDLARVLETNFEPGTDDTFNISSFHFIIWQKDASGVNKPPLNNYTEVNLYTSILRTLSSERSPRFKLNAGKQTIPMCLAAVAMMKIFKSSMWTVDIMEEILTIGDKLFTDTMIERERQGNLPTDQDIDEVYAENCLLSFNIGMNKFTIVYGAPVTGNFEDDFMHSMREFYSKPASNYNDEKELFITSDFYNVMTWYDGNVYYLFDPKSRDETGQICGKEAWSAKYEYEEGDDDARFEEAIVEKLGAWYSDDAELNKNGAACVLWFVSAEKLIKHVYENTPPNRRLYLEFKLYPITVVNKPNLRKLGEDDYAGDWYNFKEVEYGRWILRGSFNNEYVMFPEDNRGKQQLTMCYTAIGFVKRFSVGRFSIDTVNDILKYGDRLHSATRKIQVESNRVFCIGLDQIRLQITENVCSGDINAGTASDILDVPRAIKEFLENHRFGILSCRNLKVALWRGVNVFYMFDSNSNGPSGVTCPSGEACITRYLSSDAMADVFLRNLVKEGKPSFAIDLVKIRIVPCPRPLKPEEKEVTVEPAKYTGIVDVMPGKCILRGTLSQEHDVFGRGRNVQSAAVAIIALSMSLVHKPYTWTVPIVDDVLFLGDELYAASLEKLAYQYNPWEQGLPVSFVNKDYKVGSLRANFEVRPADQRGVIDIKHPNILNLRQGVERFFDENSHGVIETETLTVAVWEDEEQPGFLYMYDPNPRGPAGLSMVGGTACLLMFETYKLATDHFLANIADRVKRSGEFVITPVEIVVGNVATNTTKKEKKCRCKDDEPVDLSKRAPTTVCDKKHMREMAERERKKKEQLRLAKIGLNEYYVMANGDAILRGTKSQTSKCYSESSRGYQDIPNCFAAFVVHRLSPVGTWHFKHIDMILDVGDQLYKDSYVTYSPKNRKLGMANVLRKIYIKEVQVSLVVYKPVLTNTLNAYNLEIALTNYFQQEQFAILTAMKEYVALFFKEGYYYLFDPHARSVEGNKTDEEGVACVIKFQSIANLAAKFTENTMTQSDPACEFTITLVTVGSIVKKGEQAACCVPQVK